MEDLQQTLVAWRLDLFLRMFVAFILLAAGVAKLGSGREFAAVVRNYKLLPNALVKWVAYAVPASEVVVAAGLLTGYGLGPAAVGAALIFSLFAGAIAVNLLRGRRHISCGCFGGGGSDVLSWALVLRNLALAGAAWAVWFTAAASLGWEKLSAVETLYVMLASGAVLGIYWLWGVLRALRQLPRIDNPISFVSAKPKSD